MHQSKPVKAKMEPQKARRGISYGRVSTFDQAFNGDGSRREDASPEAQKNRCLDHVRYRSQRYGVPHEVVEHISDEGFSGKNTNRPGFQRMWGLIASGKIDFIVATELSRLSRSVFDFLELIAHCERNKVDVFIIGLDLDTTTPFGRMIVIILVALAQFEREMTSQRVRENALSRLLSDGKINGAGEILGLIRNPETRGHFIRDEEGLQKAEAFLRLFLKFSSKHKVLDAAKKMGLTGKNGRPMTLHVLDIMLENVKWRYRGLWYANKANEDSDPAALPESKRYQVVNLPHGPLLDSELLNQVEVKVADTYAKKKRSGAEGWVYLLSHVLVYSDGSKFQGQPGKDRQYRYYFNRKNDVRIRCDELDPKIVERVKSYFYGNDIFKKLVEQAVRKRETELPKIDAEIQRLRRELAGVEETSQELRQQLLDRNKRTDPTFMGWLEEQVRDMTLSKQRLGRDLEAVERHRKEVAKGSGLETLDRTVREFIDGFEKLTPVERRNHIEKIVEKIIVHPDHQLEMQIYEDPSPSVTWTKKSTGREENGGADGIRTRGLRRDRPAL